jgi:hypothetical protein
MKCGICGKGPADGVTLYRQNAKGQQGVWACEEHRLMPADPQVQEVVDIVEKAMGDGGAHR